MDRREINYYKTSHWVEGLNILNVEIRRECLRNEENSRRQEGLWVLISNKPSYPTGIVWMYRLTCINFCFV